MEITAVIDPVTRLEGHLKIHVEIDKRAGAYQVVEARSTGALFRGFEKVLVGRDPRDAQHITQRICGVCPVAHGMAAVRALDRAFGVGIPDNARIMRNLVNGANFVESHILHFFLLTLPDFIQGPMMPPWQAEWKVDRRFSKSLNDQLMGHYVQALTMRRKADQMTALFGGKAPHPNAYIPGGFTCTPRQERIDAYNGFLDELIPFIENVYIPDVELLASLYPDYFSIGKGHGHLLSYGVFDQDSTGQNKLLRQGRSLNASREILSVDEQAITEHIEFSWFQGLGAAHPSQGQSEAQNPKAEAYSWLKAPRYDNLPHEVGPLARMWCNGDYQNGISVMDRHLARAQEAKKVAYGLREWVNQLVPDGPVYNDPAPYAQEATAFGWTEAPRGALGHWLQIQGGRLSHYQVISPTTWNVGPRDSLGVTGPLEEALLGTAVQNPDKPIEVLRIIHSYDPCLDCASHILRPGKETLVLEMNGIR